MADLDFIDRASNLGLETAAKIADAVKERELGMLHFLRANVAGEIAAIIRGFKKADAA